MSTTISSHLQRNNERVFKGAAIVLSFVIYAAGLIYAGIRSYTLFASTVEAALLPLAVIGLIALELTAIALPLAIHFWTQPGPQRMLAFGFYGLDLVFIVLNSILDAAHHSGTILPAFMHGYATFALPALPAFCLVGWSLIWMFDPTSRERDMRESVKAATHESLLSGIQLAVAQADITQAVESAAQEAARALVSDALGAAPRRTAASTPGASMSGVGTRAKPAPLFIDQHDRDILNMNDLEPPVLATRHNGKHPKGPRRVESDDPDRL